MLKGAHQGPVGDVCVMDAAADGGDGDGGGDGTFVSGGMEDGAIVVFDANYQVRGSEKMGRCGN